MTPKPLTTLPPPLPTAGELTAHHLARAAGDLPTRKGVTYVWAGNGLFKHGWNGTTRALVQISHAPTPGLAALHPFVAWRGWADPLPASPLNEALTDALACYTPEAPEERQWFIVLRAGAPVLVTPEQDATAMHLAYQMPRDRVLVDVHSHHGMAPFFSGTDDADDAWLGLSVVIGRLGSPTPSAVARINCYGHHHDIALATIFAGALRAGKLPLISEHEVVLHGGGLPLRRHAPLARYEEEEEGHDDPAPAVRP